MRTSKTSPRRRRCWLGACPPRPPRRALANVEEHAAREALPPPGPAVDRRRPVETRQTQPQCRVVSVAAGLSLAIWNLIFAIISGEEFFLCHLKTIASARSGGS